MLWKFSRKFQFAADKVIPDSFVFCIILTLIVFTLGLILTTAGPMELVVHWYDGLWKMIAFAFQMSFMLVSAGAAAKAPSIERLLGWIARLPNSRDSAMVFLLVFGLVSSLINWAFSLIVTPILAMQLSRHVKGLHFPLMVAAGYSTMILGQAWCPSASVYALVASEGHFLESAIGVIKQGDSVFNPGNTVIFFILSIVTILIGLLTRPPEEEILVFKGNNTAERPREMPGEEDVTFADKMNRSKVFMWLFGIAGVAYIIYSFITKGIIDSLDFNFVIFIFLTLNAFLYNSPEKFVTAFQDSIKPATQVMMQFPFYGGVMGIMTGSGLTAILAAALIKIANAGTLPFFAYVSASVVNLFVPSQGGQWIVQGPIIVGAAKALNAEMPVLLNAFVYGDEATNLIQPLYVIPALALVNMKLKEVWGFMAFIWLIWFIVTSIGLLFIPRFF